MPAQKYSLNSNSDATLNVPQKLDSTTGPGLHFSLNKNRSCILVQLYYTGREQQPPVEKIEVIFPWEDHEVAIIL
jgi:hypothetical protein